jgi:hypothetical protein
VRLLTAVRNAEQLPKRPSESVDYGTIFRVKRFGRPFFDCLAALLLLLFLTTVCLWIRSYFRSDQLTWSGPFREVEEERRSIAITSDRGILAVISNRQRVEPPPHTGNVWISVYVDGGTKVKPAKWSFDDDVADDFLWQYLTLVNHLKMGRYVVLGRLGLGYYCWQPQWFGLFVPYWLVALLLASILAVWAYRLRRKRIALRRGLCPQCGYDLRATRDRCPECGTVPPKTEVKLIG